MVLNKDNFNNNMKFNSIVALCLVLAAIGVLADVALNDPSASDTITGATYMFNATNSSGIVGTFGNATFGWYDGATFTALCTAQSPIGSRYNCSGDTTTITDRQSTTFSVRLNNGSGIFQNDSNVTSVAVDNTAPTGSLSLGREMVELYSSITYDCSGSSDTVDTGLTYSVQLYDPDGTSQETLSSNTGTFDLSNVNQIGDWQVNCTVTDNVPLNTVANRNVTVQSRDVPVETKIAILKQPQLLGRGIFSPANVALFVVVIVGGIIVAGFLGSRGLGFRRGRRGR